MFLKISTLILFNIVYICNLNLYAVCKTNFRMSKFELIVFLSKIKNFFETLIGLKILLKKKYPFTTRSIPQYRYISIVNFLFPKGPLTLLEVGAHRGDLIEYFLEKLKNKNIQIHGIEPNDECFDFISNKFSNDIRVKLHKFGLANFKGESMLYVTKSDNLSSILKPNENYRAEKGSLYEKNRILEVKKELPIKVLKGDNFVIENNLPSIEVLSLNTQGTEIDILLGFEETLKKIKIKSIIIEVDLANRYLGGYGLYEVEKIMKEYDFELFDINLIKNILPVGIRMLDMFYVHKSIMPSRERLN